jgi:hypothetical protein
LLLIPTASTELDCLVTVLSDTSGTTPLHAACQAGRAEAVALLLHGGASADAVDSHGNTPVHIATAEGHAGCLDKIVELAGPFTLRSALSSQVHLCYPVFPTSALPCIPYLVTPTCCTRLDELFDLLHPFGKYNLTIFLLTHQFILRLFKSTSLSIIK